MNYPKHKCVKCGSKNGDFITSDLCIDCQPQGDSMQEYERLREKASEGMCHNGCIYYGDNEENVCDLLEQSYTALLAYHTKAIEGKDGIIQDIYTATQRTQKLYDIKKARFKKEIQKLKE